MEQIDVQLFASKVKDANIICSTQYGYALFLSRQNPYVQSKFSAPPDAKFFIHESSFGTALKLTLNEKVQLIAFYIRSNVPNERSLLHNVARKIIRNEE